MKKILVCILFILGLLPVESKAQTLAVKSNLLYDATTTMNLGLEVALSRKWTLDIPVNYNPWKFDDTRLKHWGIQPELRYWFCESFNRTFIGLHAHYADFNVGGWPDWPLISDNMQNMRYQGRLYGGGFSIGHSWILKNVGASRLLSGWDMRVFYMINILAQRAVPNRKMPVRITWDLQKRAYHLFT